MKTIKYETVNGYECVTPCPVFAKVKFPHPMYGVQIGSLSCQECIHNDYKKMDIDNNIIVCKAQEEDTNEST